MLIKLKGCPFCGARADMDIDDEGWGYIYCSHDNWCPMHLHEDSEDNWCEPHQVQSVADGWNRREAR